MLAAVMMMMVMREGEQRGPQQQRVDGGRQRRGSASIVPGPWGCRLRLAGPSPHTHRERAELRLRLCSGRILRWSQRWPSCQQPGAPWRNEQIRASKPSATQPRADGKKTKSQPWMVSAVYKHSPLKHDYVQNGFSPCKILVSIVYVAPIVTNHRISL